MPSIVLSSLDAALDKIDAVLGTPPEQAPRQLVYILVQVGRLGQLAQEIFQIQSIFHGEYDECVLITPPLSERVNVEVFRIFTRGMRWVPCADEEVLHLGWADLGSVRRGNRLYALYNPSTLYRLMFERLMQGGTFQHVTLTAEDERRGLALRRAFGIPAEARIVTLHVREAGYLPHARYHAFRDADIATYIPAMEFLIRRGFYVVRLGDPTMQRLVSSHPQLIDAPFHPAYEPFVDPYFLWCSDFLLGTLSGPWSVARAFNKPILAVNSPVQAVVLAGPQDLFVYKKYFSHSLGRLLTYREVLLSPLVDFSRHEEFTRYGVQLVPNTPEEILRSTAEMVEHLAGTYKPTPAIYAKLREDEHLAHLVRSRGELPFPYFGPAVCQARVSEEYVRCNPFLLGHQAQALL
ncbi:MAG: hypothetical protein KatS3mg131_1071 [Candidatus Tectimicrobiota bacterium]|nr:MAG: hypothetical protein KatS3mg131_1071 [Candidatus Tectomicrobia bacterium]